MEQKNNETNRYTEPLNVKMFPGILSTQRLIKVTILHFRFVYTNNVLLNFSSITCSNPEEDLSLAHIL